METSETKSKATSDMGGNIRKKRVSVPQTRVETSETKSKGTSDMYGDITNKEQPCVETSQNKEWWWCSISQLNTRGVSLYTQLCVDKFISWGKHIACVTVVVVVFITPRYRQPHAVFGRFISISGGLMLIGR